MAQCGDALVEGDCTFPAGFWGGQCKAGCDSHCAEVLSRGQKSDGPLLGQVHAERQTPPSQAEVCAGAILQLCEAAGEKAVLSSPITE